MGAKEVFRGRFKAGDHGASWINAVYFYGDMSQEQAVSRSGWEQFYYGPGQPFGKEPLVWQVGKRTLVTQQVGWDV